MRKKEGLDDLNGLKLYLAKILLHLDCILPQLNTLAKDASYHLQDVAWKWNYYYAFSIKLWREKKQVKNIKETDEVTWKVE